MEGELRNIGSAGRTRQLFELTDSIVHWQILLEHCSLAPETGDVIEPAFLLVLFNV